MTVMAMEIKELNVKQLEKITGGMGPVTSGKGPKIKVNFSKSEYLEQKKKQETLVNN
ncbi:bacteriocin signal sequence domain-containing protein [Butyrivibrio proteoclasticus B316]|uniref:Bacteriocin signal sequence domain-containing protein n=1 Tax=Butyrivibrio proteoclasticus (strain ATCC 51982 / DSM 14932 / B316) TaxID=515622 RepID=E0S350_BUTPB|nr:bacteriocin [Butyrivibrio proteoclasticus]ADL35832.1 bacteriocin signal sequence domain-containing protein [Butyrivibrio proteoclasticus B316]